MHGLMSLWFGPLVELEADLGYFYLCPACHDELIVPELERIQNRILELHPAAQRHLDELEAADTAKDAEDAVAGEDADSGTAEDPAGDETDPREDPAANEDPREKAG